MHVSDIAVKLIVLTLVLSLLPGSPFTGFGSLVSQIPYLSYLNWFLPIPEIIVIMESWLAVVSVYYTILFALNYVGLLKS